MKKKNIELFFKITKWDVENKNNINLQNAIPAYNLLNFGGHFISKFLNEGFLKILHHTTSFTKIVFKIQGNDFYSVHNSYTFVLEKNQRYGKIDFGCVQDRAAFVFELQAKNLKQPSYIKIEGIILDLPLQILKSDDPEVTAIRTNICNGISNIENNLLMPFLIYDGLVKMQLVYFPAAKKKTKNTLNENTAFEILSVTAKGVIEKPLLIKKTEKKKKSR